jgi:hypothetical protein
MTPRYQPPQPEYPTEFYALSHQRSTRKALSVIQRDHGKVWEVGVVWDVIGG